MTDKKSKLQTKVSPLIEGQVPDFIQADHPIFVKFLKEYYKFLEAGQVTYEVVNSYIRFETTTTAYVLDEKDGDRILTEDTPQFVNGETITGATSGATATILVEDSRNLKLYVSSVINFCCDEIYSFRFRESSTSIVAVAPEVAPVIVSP